MSPTAGVSRRPLRIVRFIARLNIGGPARHAVLVDSGLRDRGHATLLVHGSPAPEEGSLRDLVSSHGLPERMLPELGRSLRPLNDIRALVRMTRLLFRERPDVVHTHTAKAGTLGRFAAFAYNVTRKRHARCLVVHTFHGHVFTGYFGRTGSRAVRIAERILARVTDRIVAISERQRDDLVNRFRIAPAEKVALIPLGLDLDAFLDLPAPTPSAKSAFGIPGGHVVVGFVGRFVPIKDLETLLRAFALVTSPTQEVTLLLVGDGECAGRLRHLAAALGLDGRVRFAGWRRDLVTVYGAVDVAVISSINEGTPVALIEAMAAGRPVVATRVGGVPDLVSHQVTGLLVEPRAPDRLAAALAGICNDADLRRRLGEAARHDVRGRFAAGRLVEDVAGLYDTGLRQKRPGWASA